MICLENEFLRVGVDLEHGAALSELLHKPANVNVLAPSGAPNGFDAIRFEAGPEQRDANGRSRVCTAVEQPPRWTKRFALKAGAPILVIEETLTNTNSEECAVLMCARVAFGAPLAGADCRIDAPVVSYFDPREEPILRMRWPKLADGTDLSNSRAAGTETRRFYLTDFSEGLCRLENAAQKLSVEVRWDAAQLPYCWIEERANEIRVAPASGLPTAAEDGHGLIAIPPGASATMRTEIRISAV